MAALAICLVALSDGPAAGAALPGTEQLIEQWNGAAWAQGSAPNLHGGSALSGAVAFSAKDAWAVGSRVNAPQTGPFHSYPLAEHWTGTAWKSLTVPAPKVTGPGADLVGVAGSSAGNVWAIGYAGTYARAKTLFEHWNGHSWRLEATTSERSFSPGDVAVASARAAWAVGTYLDGKGRLRMRIMRWNGSSWRRVPTSHPGGSGGSDELSAVSASSARNVWAVGQYRRATHFHTLVLHWDGSSWKRVASPTPGATHSASLDGVVALGAKNVWAVGEYRGSQNSQRPLVEHWDGRRWKVVSAPGSGSLDAVSAASAKDVWAVGTVFTTGAQGFTEHWDGTSWKSVPMPDQPAAGGLAGVAAVSAHDAWAVGTFEPAP